VTKIEPIPVVSPLICVDTTLAHMTGDEQSPGGLVDAARAGDRVAFGRLVEPWLTRSLGAAVVVTRSHADGADAVQDALLAAWQGLDTLRDKAAFAAWFRTLVVRSALRIARRRASMVPIEVADLEGMADNGLDDSVDRRQLGRAFDSLDAGDRALLTLRFLWDLPVADTAAALDIQPGTVKSRTHAAIGRLRAAFDAEARL
jgi:RNA polymerase sigma-70 factor (ECF subfamily)